MRCVSPVAGAVRGTTARLSLGRKRRGDMRRFLPFCDPCAVWILEAASPIEVNNSVCIRAKHGLCIPAALLRGVGEVGFRGRSMAEPGTAARCRSTRSKCAHPHGRLPELRRRARPAPPKRESAPTAHPRPSPHAVGATTRIASSVGVADAARHHAPATTPRGASSILGKDLRRRDGRHTRDTLL